jgi:hypothetical protein
MADAISTEIDQNHPMGMMTNLPKQLGESVGWKI